MSVGFFPGKPTPPVPIPFGLTTIGSVIPVSAGQRAIPGQVIWCSEFRLVNLPVSQRQWQNVSGGSVGVAGFRTRGIGVDFAVAFGYPLVPDATLFVGRIWIDSGAGFALAYDAITNTVPSVDNGINFTLYKGDPVQTPNPTILAVQGDLTPGFNNLIYMVFTDFPTGKVGLPSIKVEFFGSTDVSDVFTPFTKLASSPIIDNRAAFLDWRTLEMWGWSDSATSTPKIHKFDIEDGEELEKRSFTVDPSSNGLNNEFALYDQEERIVITTESPASNSVPLISVDVDGGGIAARFGVHSVSTTTDDTHLAYPTHGAIVKGMGPGPGPLTGALVLGGFLNNDLTLFAYGSGSLTFKETEDISAAGSGSIKTIAAVTTWMRDGFTDLLKQAGEVQQDFTVLVGLNNELWQYDYGIRDGNLEKVGQLLLTTYAAGHNVIGIVTDINNSVLVVFTRNASDSFAICRTYGINLSTSWRVNFARHYKGMYPVFLEYAATIGGMSASPLNFDAPGANPLKEFQVPPPDTGGNRFENILRYSPLRGQKIAYQSGAVFTLLDYARGEAALRPITETGSVQEYFFDALGNSAYITGNFTSARPTGVVKLDVPGPSGLTIGMVCLHTAVLVGYDEADVFVDPLLIDPVLGIIINRPWGTDALFRNLGLLYDFQHFESEGKIKFIRTPKGESAPTAESLTIHDLAPISEGNAEGNEAVITAIDEPADIPAGVSVAYIDPDREYEINTQQFLNNNSVVPTQNANVLAIEVPLVMTTADAYQRAGRLAFATSEMSITQQFRLPWEYSRLEPSDLVDLTISNFRYMVQVTDVTFNGDFSLSCQGRNYAFRDDIVIGSDGNLGNIPQPLPGSSASKPILLDMPYFLGSDDSGQVPTAYAAVTSYGQANWSGAAFWRARVSGGYEGLFASDVLAVTGTVNGVVPPTDLPFTTDGTNQINLILRTGSSDNFIDAATREDFLAGVNAIAIGKPGRWELIFFRAVLVAADSRSVTLYGLLRGRRGTEVNCNNHEDRDDFVLIRSANEDYVFDRHIVAYDPDDIGDAFKYKAAMEPGANALEIQDTYRANALRPWAVSTLEAVLQPGDDILLSWFRRTRIATDFDEQVGFPQDIPLAEASEEYEIEIYDDIELVRTLTATTNSVTYTAAEQTADGFVPPLTALSVKVFQMSAVAGRGFEASGGLDVHQ